MDEDLEIEKDLLDQQASKLGCIEVFVTRTTRKKLRTPLEMNHTTYTPWTSTDTSKEMVKEKHISPGTVLGETRDLKDPGPQKYMYYKYTKENCCPLRFLFRYRSRVQLQRLGIGPQSPVSTSVGSKIQDDINEDQTTPIIANTNAAQESAQPIKVEAERIKTEDEECTQPGQRLQSERATMDRIVGLEKENRELHEQLQRLNANQFGLTAFKDQMIAALQSLTSNQTTTAPLLPVAPIPAPKAITASSESLPRSVSVKRERSLMATDRSSKRPKVVDLTSD